MIALFIFLIASAVSFCIAAVCIEEVEGFLYGTIFSVSVLIAISLGMYIFHESTDKTPTAVDVYRGKTTLEITYRDSVAVDSVVVWKEGK